MDKNITLLPHEIQLIEKCIAWSAQQSYYQAEETAKAFGRLTGKEMFLDQAYYNSYAWRDVSKANLISQCSGSVSDKVARRALTTHMKIKKQKRIMRTLKVRLDMKTIRTLEAMAISHELTKERIAQLIIEGRIAKWKW